MHIALLKPTLQEGKLHDFEDDMANDIGKIFEVSLLLNFGVLKNNSKNFSKISKIPSKKNYQTSKISVNHSKNN